MAKHYDRDYFERWYRDPALKRAAIGGAARLSRKVALAVSTAEYWLERPLRSVLDIGCGEGAWQPAVKKLRPKASYIGFDSSAYAIERFGRRRNLHLASFADFASLRPCAPADLLVCSDVMHYLEPRELDAGLPGLAELCSGVAFLETFTREDEIEGDTAGFRRRPARFYRTRLQAAGFVPLGSHLWLSPALADQAAALEIPG
ncbi:class I SAM-dependent DNA methyltransferase [Lysobacter claricitrinus]|uniref:class I SAM-dependent DNA methyltransferase n=1 Tax=Lysobacter claricitrinus TaxID=3367728 RepID=UPI0037DB357B